jgi:hypothetical protein
MILHLDDLKLNSACFLNLPKEIGLQEQKHRFIVNFMLTESN